MPFDVIQNVPLSGYAPESALGLDATAAQVYVSGKALMWEPIGGGANFPVNTNITAMEGIPNTVINSTGYALGTIGDGTGVVITNGNITAGILDTAHKGWELGMNIGSGVGGTLLLSAVGGGVTLSPGSGLSMGAGIICGTILSNGGIACASGVITTGQISNYAPGVPLSLSGSDGIAAGSPNVLLNGLINYANSTTQSTVGAAGGASALPATPSLYELKEVNGTKYVSPLYLPS
jgi:hypothetical protein